MKHNRTKMKSDVEALARRINDLSRLRPALGMVLGSGFKHVLNEVEVAARVAYAKLPGFPRPTVAGHEGELVIGRLGGTHRRQRRDHFSRLGQRRRRARVDRGLPAP